MALYQDEVWKRASLRWLQLERSAAEYAAGKSTACGGRPGMLHSQHCCLIANELYIDLLRGFQYIFALALRRFAYESKPAWGSSLFPRRMRGDGLRPGGAAQHCPALPAACEAPSPSGQLPASRPTVTPGWRAASANSDDQSSLEKSTCGPTGLRPSSLANSSRMTRIFPPTTVISG